jgi:hypothetical protein
MPIYCYITEGGETAERQHPMGKAPKTVRINGKRANRDFMAEQGGRRAVDGGWPIECVASGVHADQAQELRDFFKSHNCPTEVTNGGDPIYRNASHQRRALKVRNLHLNNSFM